MERSMDSSASNKNDSFQFEEKMFAMHELSPIRGAPSSSRKRKSHDFSLAGSPQLSSTLNESVLSNLEQCHIDYEKAKKPCLGATPEKQKMGAISEKHELLYRNIKLVEPPRKNLTPHKSNIFKYNERMSEKVAFQRENKSQFELLSDVLSNRVIMDKIFDFLSNGDLFRMSQVSVAFKMAVLSNVNAIGRYLEYNDKYKHNKENYQITPPTSPEKNDSPPGSPDNRAFNDFIQVAKTLKPPQTLTKCPLCQRPCIVENNLGQCQNVYSCGYIYCLLCLSHSSTGPENFVDKCKNSALQIERRSKLNDISGCFSDLSNTSSYLMSSFNSSKYDSGFYSENSSPVVKRNLNQSVGGEKKVLVMKNYQAALVKKQKFKRKSVVVPVVALTKKSVDVNPPSPPSPPKNDNYKICSRQSKRFLKRLTF